MNLKSIVICGRVPTVLVKLGMREGSSVPNYLVQMRATVLCVGLLATVLGSGWVSSPRAQMFAVLMGLAWASAIGSMAYAKSTLGEPVSVVAPLIYSNARVAMAARAGRHRAPQAWRCRVVDCYFADKRSTRKSMNTRDFAGCKRDVDTANMETGEKLH